MRLICENRLNSVIFKVECTFNSVLLNISVSEYLRHESELKTFDKLSTDLWDKSDGISVDEIIFYFLESLPYLKDKN